MEDKRVQNRAEGRREFVRRALVFAASLPALAVTCGSCRAQADRREPSVARTVGGGCGGCDVMYEGMPRELDWQTTFADESEPGERMEMSGRIYRADAKTPAPGVVLYVYHTDAKGYYSPGPNVPERARRHGHLRGWVKTGAGGEYKFRSIRPAPYPGLDNPAHIHPVLKEPGKNEYYIDEYVFDDDPLLTRARRDAHENRGGSGIIRLTRSAGGVWTGTRDIVLGRNIPNYS